MAKTYKPRKPKPPITEYQVPIELCLNIYDGQTLREAINNAGLEVNDILDARIHVEYEDYSSYNDSVTKLVVGQKTIDNTLHPNYPILLKQYQEAMARYEERLKL